MEGFSKMIQKFTTNQYKVNPPEVWLPTTPGYSEMREKMSEESKEWWADTIYRALVKFLNDPKEKKYTKKQIRENWSKIVQKAMYNAIHNTSK